MGNIVIWWIIKLFLIAFAVHGAALCLKSVFVGDSLGGFLQAMRAAFCVASFTDTPHP